MIMAQTWFLCVLSLIIVKDITAPKAPVRQRGTHPAVPLSKPPGNSRPKVSRNLEDRRFGQEYIEQYQEMMKASQESFESFDERDEKRLKRVIGDDDLELMAEAGGLPRRRSASKLQSAVGRRQARSQAVRRKKLRVQGIRSHRHHSKQTPDLNYDTV